MTNLQIIGTACMMNGITEEVDTYAGWQRRGMQVTKGNKALFKTKIWKPVKGKAKSNDEETDEIVGRLILVNAAFFGVSQVEEIPEESREKAIID